MSGYPVERGETVILTVEELAFGGRGVARVDGFTVFVESGLPGQKVEAVIFRRRRRYAEARIQKILVPSPREVDPPCSHFGLCGGCSFQHLEYAAQLDFKREQVRDCLVRLGGLSADAVDVLATLPSPAPYAYRNKMEFSFSTRWLAPEELTREDTLDRFGLGLHVRGRFDRVVNVEQCHIQAPEGSRILARVRELARDSGLPAYSTRTHQGFWRFLVLRHGTHTGDWMVHLVTHAAPPGSAEKDTVLRIAETLQNEGLPITSFIHGITTSKASIAVSETTETLFGESVIRDRILDLTYEIGPNTFFQTNTLGAEHLYTQVLELGDFSPRETAWDLYCGVGTLSLVLAPRVRTVIGMEIVAPAVAAAERNAQQNGITNTRFLAGDVAKLISETPPPEQPDVVVVNPPRDGLHPKVVTTLIELAPGRIVYVSCNPATLARDIERFGAGGYRVKTVQPVDMFPHTPHVECVTVLYPEG